MNRVLAKLFGSAASAPTNPTATSVQSSSLDLAAILQRLEGDHSLLRELIAVYHRDWPRWGAELTLAIEKGDWPQVAFKAHRLRGLVRTFSAGAADDALAGFEAAAQNRQADEATSRWHSVLPLLERLARELEIARG